MLASGRATTINMVDMAATMDVNKCECDIPTDLHRFWSEQKLMMRSPCSPYERFVCASCLLSRNPNETAFSNFHRSFNRHNLICHMSSSSRKRQNHIHLCGVEDCNLSFPTAYQLMKHKKSAVHQSKRGRPTTSRRH